MNFSLETVTYKTLKTLSTYVDNLLTHPENEKFYKINTQNKSFIKHILLQPDAYKTLLYLNFIEIDDYMELHQYSSEKLINIMNIIRELYNIRNATKLLDKVKSVENPELSTPVKKIKVSIKKKTTSENLQIKNSKKRLQVFEDKKHRKQQILKKIKLERHERNQQQKILDYRNSRDYQLKNKQCNFTKERGNKMRTINDFSDSDS